MVAINKLHRIIIVLLLVCFICVFSGLVTSIGFQRIGIANDTGFSLLIGFSFCLLVFLLIAKCFQLVDLLSEKACLIISLLILTLIAGVFTLVSFSARVTQFSDSLDVMDSALYLSKHGELSENLPYIKYVGCFGNNYPQILIQSYLIKKLIQLGVQDVENVLNHLNVIVLVAAIIVTWLIVKETRGIRAATKTVFICLLNPYLYLIVNWTYTMTYSMPIMMGMLYVVLHMKGKKLALGGVVLALFEGVLIGVGFLIRPTSIFPLIAAIIVWQPFTKKGIKKDRIVQFNGKATPISFKEFRTKFATEEDCRNYLFEERFPEGFVCPKCGGSEYYFLKKRRVCQCKSCRRQTSVTTGTVMYRTHLPLTVWFWAIYLCATDKRGISAKGLARQLELSYESAWYLLVRIRSAMQDRDQNYMLEGLIEMDEAYLGAPKRGKKRGRGTERKKMAVAVSKTENDCPLFLRLQMIPDVTTASLQSVINESVKTGSTIECDGYKSYPGLENVFVDASAYETGDLKWVHVAIGNFKAFLLGTYHGSCGDYQPYLNEYCFRYNRRFRPDQLFTRLSRAVATSRALLS